MLIADAILNFITLIGVVAAFLAGLKPNKSSLDDKLSILYGSLVVFFLARQIFYFHVFPFLVNIIMASGAIMPFLILLLAEEVLRRHAKRYIKLFILAGAGIFFIGALLLGAVWPIFWLTLFAAYCALSLLIIALFLIKNRNNQNSPFETKMVDSFTIAIAVCSLLVVTEFRGLWPNIPITLGAIGILIFVNTTYALSSEKGSPRELLQDLAIISLSVTLLDIAILILRPGVGFNLMMQVWAFAFAINIVLLGLYRNIENYLDARFGKNLLEKISEIGDNSSLNEIISAHPLTSSGKILGLKELQLYDDETISDFLQERVINRETYTKTKTAEALSNLLDETGANYLLRLNRSPAKFLAIATGQIGFDKKLDTELRIFTLIAERAGND